MKLKLIAFVSLSYVLANLALTACSSNNDVPDPIEDEDIRTLKEKLVGSWSGEKIRLRGEWFNIATQADWSETITFDADGTFSGVGGHTGGSGVYIIKDSTIELKDATGTLIHTYVVKGIDSKNAEIKVTSCTDKHRFIFTKN